MGTPEGKRTIVRTRRRLEIDGKNDLKEIDWEGVDWIDPALYMHKWRAPVNGVMNLQLP